MSRCRPCVAMISVCLLCVWTSQLAGVEAVGWNGLNNPARFRQQLQSQWTGPEMQFNINSLPTSGRSPFVPWSDTYWPNKYGGIAQRWMLPGAGTPQGMAHGFNYKLHSLDELRAMGTEGMKKLSPAEKFDIYNGRYDYPTVRSEWSRCRPTDVEWEGVCHGWAPASFNFKQPNPVTLTNPQGLPVPFGSSDIKALLIYFVAQYSNKGYVQPGDAQVAGRCRFDIKRNPALANIPECSDSNAGSFHIILANMVGLQNRPFVIDRDRNMPVWNQPVFAFESRITQVPAFAEVRTRISYSKETPPSWNPHNALIVFEDYAYRLEVDGAGRIMGGEYLQFERPDFIWVQKTPQFYGYFASLKNVYEASAGAAPATVGVPATSPSPLPSTARPRAVSIPPLRAPSTPPVHSVHPVQPGQPHSPPRVRTRRVRVSARPRFRNDGTLVEEGVAAADPDPDDSGFGSGVNSTDSVNWEWEDDNNTMGNTGENVTSSTGAASTSTRAPVEYNANATVAEAESLRVASNHNWFWWGESSEDAAASADTNSQAHTHNQFRFDELSEAPPLSEASLFYESVNSSSLYLNELAASPPIDSFAHHHVLEDLSGEFSFSPGLTSARGWWDSNLDLQPSLHETFHLNHEAQDATGFGAENEDIEGPRGISRASWGLLPLGLESNNVSRIVLTFRNLNLRRWHEELKVYESHRCDGAMLASLHGDDDLTPDTPIPSASASASASGSSTVGTELDHVVTVQVRSSSACIIFLSSETAPRPVLTFSLRFQSSTE